MTSVAIAKPVHSRISDPAALRRALDPSQVRRPLSCLLRREQSDIAVILERMHFSTNRPAILQYRVRGNTDAADAVVLAELVGNSAETHAADETVRLAKSRRGQVAKGDTFALLADPDLGLVFRRAGLDAKLPGLRLLYDPKCAAEAAAKAAGAAVRGLSVTTTLRAHRLGKRAVLQLDLHGSHTGRIFVRLRPTSSASGESAYVRHYEIAAALTGVPGIAVPQPLFHDADLGAAFFDALSGHVPRFGRAEGIHTAKAVARALMSIITHGPETAAPYSEADELVMLVGWSDRTCNVFPAIASAAGRALTAVEKALFRKETVRQRPCHRDFHEGQILMHEGRVGVLDFDTYRLADPALDIGNLIAHLRMKGLRENRSLVRIEDTLRRCLRSHVRSKNVDGWTRAALLRLGCIYAFTSAGPKLARALFREAAR